jgi:hypothetical protein
MAIFLRLIGLVAGLSVFATAVFIARFAQIGLRPLLATGAFGFVTVVGWLVTFVVGPIAMVQLLRVKNSGRFAGALLFGFMFLYYAVGLFAFRAPGTPIAPIVMVCGFLAFLVIVLLSPAARRTCTAAAVIEELTK